jgi:hypothetical protein
MNLPVCHREERSRFDKLKAPSLSWGDVAIQLEYWIAAVGLASFAMTNRECSFAGAKPIRQAQGPEPVEGLDCRALVPRARNDNGTCANNKYRSGSFMFGTI